MGEFVRYLDQILIDKLQQEPLFGERLVEDIRSGIVFPAIRNNRLDFYYGGGKLFSYASTGFLTHIKYASVITSPRSYVREGELPSLSPIDSFVSVYDRIKENCALYSGVEAQGVSDILKSFGRFVSGKAQSMIPLDIEICFDAADADPFEVGPPRRRKDRIDILFYDMKKGVLRFCEAKHYSNGEIWSKASIPPRVTGQLCRYKKQIAEREDSILVQYRTYIGLMNQLLGTSMPEPRFIDADVPVFLLVFGFDKDQQEGRLTRLLLADGSLREQYCYTIGNTRSISLDNMWRRTKCWK